jgi:hypothetical protein
LLSVVQLQRDTPQIVNCRAPLFSISDMNILGFYQIGIKELRSLELLIFILKKKRNGSMDEKIGTG